MKPRESNPPAWALEAAAQVWCDQYFSNLTMDTAAAYRIAENIVLCATRSPSPDTDMGSEGISFAPKTPAAPSPVPLHWTDAIGDDIEKYPISRGRQRSPDTAEPNPGRIERATAVAEEAEEVINRLYAENAASQAEIPRLTGRVEELEDANGNLVTRIKSDVDKINILRAELEANRGDGRLARALVGHQEEVLALRAELTTLREAAPIEIDRMIHSVWYRLKSQLGPGKPQQILNSVIDEIRAEYSITKPETEKPLPTPPQEPK